jgi:hypothetical protein
MGQGVLDAVARLLAGQLGQMGHGVLSISDCVAPKKLGRYYDFLIWTGGRGLFLFSLCIYLTSLFSFLQSRRGEKTLSHLSRIERDSKSGNKEEEGILI